MACCVRFSFGGWADSSRPIRTHLRAARGAFTGHSMSRAVVVAEIYRMIQELDAEMTKLEHLIGTGREVRAELVRELERIRDGDPPAAEIIRIKP